MPAKGGRLGGAIFLCTAPLTSRILPCVGMCDGEQGMPDVMLEAFGVRGGVEIREREQRVHIALSKHGEVVESMLKNLMLEHKGSRLGCRACLA